jgi:hypothetical protein
MFPQRFKFVHRTQFSNACFALLLFSLVGGGSAQTIPNQATTVSKPSEILHSALNHVDQTITGLNISHWKASSEIRAATQQNVDSIQRDLSATLPGLLTQADASPGQVSAVFPVYRNIDALYDVLLRVSQIANVSAPQSEAASIVSALNQLESARTRLGDSILTNSKNTETKLTDLQTAIQKAAAAQAATPPKTVIVDNGPVKTSRHKKKTNSSGNNPNSGNSSSTPQ